MTAAMTTAASTAATTASASAALGPERVSAEDVQRGGPQPGDPLHPHGVRLRHRFQAAHRLPHLAGQCQSLHGHSWTVAVTVTAPALGGRDRTVVEFGAFKAGFRRWVDAVLDHGTMLAATDPLVPMLTADGSKVFRFGARPDPLVDGPGDWAAAEHLAVTLAYPTVEEVAVLLGRVAHQVLTSVPHAPLARVGLIEVEETETNAAWHAPAYRAPGPADPIPAPSGGITAAIGEPAADNPGRPAVATSGGAAGGGGTSGGGVAA